MRFYEWRVASGGPGGRWFITRWIRGEGRGMEVLEDKAGRRRYFKDHATARRALAKIADS